MRVVLRVEVGEPHGRTMLVRPGQEITVGRTHYADFVCETDNWMSSVHFALVVNGESCLLRDRNSTNGTKLNGTFVKEGNLQHGDRILAGQTEFVIEIEQHEVVGPVGPTLEITNADQRFLLDHLRTADVGDAPYVAERMATGLTHCRAPSDGDKQSTLEPYHVVNALTRFAPLTMIVDPGRGGVTIPPAMHAEPLHAWLAEGPARQQSPQIVTAQPSPELDELIETAWDSDALLCFYSKLEPARLVEHFRKAAGGSDGKSPKRDVVFGFFYPSLLDHLLRTQPQGPIDHLLEGIEGVLLEVPGIPASWQLFARPSLAEKMDLLGFRQAK